MMHMMPFQTHAALALQMIALVSGVLLLNKACGEGFFCKKTGKIIGSLVTLISLLSIACTFYLSIRQCCQQNDMKGWHHPEMGKMMEMPGMPEPKK